MPGNFPPRGFGPDATEVAQDARWGDPTLLAQSWDYAPGKVLLGQWRGRELGRLDDRHMVTIAGSRAGKSRTVLIPNLLRYPGSVVVIDPKGELARETAQKRAEFGDVYILDPFGVSGFRSASFNPIWELMYSTETGRTADAALIADALIINSERETHWTDSAKNLVRGTILHLLTTDPHTATLANLRHLLTGSNEELKQLLTDMAASQAHGGIVSNTGRGFLGKVDSDGAFSGELRSIISTAIEQTWPLDDVAAISERSDFFLPQLSERPTTVYLVLPATRLATHFRWLRLVINLALAALERTPVRDLAQGGLPVWFLLEEFAALGQMKAVETAAGFMAGMGCKLWVVLQDLTQLKTHYPDSWETFLGNAGVIQAWSNVDVTTTEYLSKLIGQTTILETRIEKVSAQAQAQGDVGERTQYRTVPLLDPTEITFHFARERGLQIILSPGRPPLFIERLADGSATQSQA